MTEQRPHRSRLLLALLAAAISSTAAGADGSRWATTRRRGRFHAAILSAALLVGLLTGAFVARTGGAVEAPADARRSVAYTTRTMGTYGTVVLVTPDSARSWPVARLAHGVFGRVDSLMSNWTTTSEVARLNRVAASETALVHPEVATVLDSALALWRESDGAFDITVEPLVRLWGFLGGPRRVPSEAEITTALERVGAQRVHFDRARRTLRFDRDGVKIDLGGIAKGYAVDVAAESLAARGVADALVNVSGNMRALGSPVASRSWRIGIRDPRDRMPYFARLEIHQQGVSTSGQYEQFVAANGKTYGHILDPRTGHPSEGLISVTVVAPSALDADSWDTPLFVLGPERARRKAKEREDIAAVLVEPGTGGVDTVWVERSLAPRFTLEPQARPLFVVKYF